MPLTEAKALNYSDSLNRELRSAPAFACGPRLLDRCRRRHVPSRVPSASENRGKQGPARSVGGPCTARVFAADIRAGVPGRKSPISHIMRDLFQDYGLAPLRRAALLAKKLVRCSMAVAVVPPLLPYAANFRD